MKFCPECGTAIEGKKFCSECGYKIVSVPEAKDINITKMDTKSNQEVELLKFSTYLFGLENQKKNIGSNVEVSFPKENYTLTTERLFIEKQGVVTKKREEIELYLIKDINVKQGLKEKVLKVGDIEIICKDLSLPVITLKRIQDPYSVYEVIRGAVRDLKKTMNVTYKEEL